MIHDKSHAIKMLEATLVNIFFNKIIKIIETQEFKTKTYNTSVNFY